MAEGVSVGLRIAVSFLNPMSFSFCTHLQELAEKPVTRLEQLEQLEQVLAPEEGVGVPKGLS